MDKLNNSSFLDKEELKNIPDKGIYVFYENGNPVYVGRSEKLKKRIQQHNRPSSGHTSATFAFNIAKQIAQRSEIDIERSRSELEKDPKFVEIFKNAKIRVSNMQIKVIEIDDPITQTLFEVYSALELKTEYNDWRTH